MRRTYFLLLLLALLLILLSSVSQAGPPAQAAQALITEPQANDTIRGRISILGIASHPQFDRYELGYSREPASNSTWVFMMDSRTQVTQVGLLGFWETATVPDGIYALRLRVIRRDGNYDEVFVRNLTVANIEPTETPTPGITETPTLTPTPRPPTPTIIVQQPERETPTVLPRSPTPVPGSVTTPSTGQISGDGGGGFNLGSLDDAFVSGVRYAGLAIVVVGLLFAFKSLLTWLWERGFGRRG